MSSVKSLPALTGIQDILRAEQGEVYQLVFKSLKSDELFFLRGLKNMAEKKPHLFEDGRDKERLDAKEEDDRFWFGEENWFNPFFKFVSFVCVV